MNKRKAFTLIELLVVIGIILVLMGILIPVVTRMRRSAQITGQKADFVTISQALDQYRQDFGDYPRNGALTTWNTIAAPAPVFLSLATALLGPGPAVTGNGQVGDGSDGLGFRCQAISSFSGGINLSGGTYIFTPGGMNAGQLFAMAGPGNYTASTSQPVVIRLLPSTNYLYTETIWVTNMMVSGTAPNQTITLNLAFPPANTTHTQAVISMIGGKVWGPYVPADTFKVAYVPAADVNGAGISQIQGSGQPVLLDRWGQTIQYFPRYGQPNNRTNDSALFRTGSLASVQTGPLYGFSQPLSIDSKWGWNAMYDARDGAPFYSAVPSPASGVNPVFCQLWGDVTTLGTNTPTHFQPDWTIQWMLGDVPNSTGSFDNVIGAGEKLNSDTPFILISAGPDGPNRSNGGFCSFANPTTGALTDPTSGNVLTPVQLSKMFTDSGNIYNFDHP